MRNQIELERLLERKKEIIYKKKKDTNKESFIDYCEQSHKEYYKTICSMIEALGSETEVKGHSDSLDKEKNFLFNLIGL